MKDKIKILFLCTGNSCRSQTAQGWAGHLKGDSFEAYSAGIETHGLNPNAVKVMAEAGVDISNHKSKHVDELKDIDFDYVITVCDSARESCPIFAGKAKVIHVGFDDPPKLAKEAKNEQEALNIYRRVRDEIRKYIETLPQSLQVSSPDEDEKVRQAVRREYGGIAKGQSSCCCGSSSPEKLAQAMGYTDSELKSLPEGVNLGLSCGNPTAIADLKPGQVVLDLGSGGGIDVFVGAMKVGPEGKSIGVDMTAEMINKARASIPGFTNKTGLSNVEFRLGEIEHLPVADNSVDVVISNCVINLSPEKPQVWKEIFRVLKHGGKACVSDIALKEELPEKIKSCVQALIGCIAGAVSIEETADMMKAAGFSGITCQDKPFNIDVMDNCNDPLYKAVNENLPPDKKIGDFVSSVDFVGYKK